MKKLLTILLLATTTMVKAQQMYKMESVVIYDSVGNQYQLREVLDHLPTAEDSVRFQRDARKYVAEISRVHKEKRGVKLYQAIVAEVRVNKSGSVSIKPVTKFRSPWYRYNDPNVKVGDTIWISREDAIEPKF